MSEETPVVNWTLIQDLAKRPHKHLNINHGGEYGVMVDGVFDRACNGVGEVMEEARAVQHLCDLAGVPEGEGYSAHIDARVFLLLDEVLKLRERLDRISRWHALETGPGGTVGLWCAECSHIHPCDTARMADGTYVDPGEPS